MLDDIQRSGAILLSRKSPANILRQVWRTTNVYEHEKSKRHCVDLKGRTIFMGTRGLAFSRCCMCGWGLGPYLKPSRLLALNLPPGIINAAQDSVCGEQHREHTDGFQSQHNAVDC